MAKTAKSRKKSAKKLGWFARQRLLLRLIVRRGALAVLAIFLIAITAFAIFDPPTTWTIYSEERRLGTVKHEWIPAEDIAPVMLRAVVAAQLL